MTTRYLLISLTGAAVSLGAMVSLSPADAQTLKDTQRQVTPGFNPDNGKINPGVPVQAPSGSPPGLNDRSGGGETVKNRAAPVDTTAASGQPIPTPEEARAALLSPDSSDAAIGQIPLPPSGATQTAKSAVGDAPAEMAKSQQSDNNAQSGDSKSSGSSAQTTGAATPEDTARQAAQRTTPNMPIGSTGQTLPAKFSKRNDTLDRLPTMAWPIRLSDEQRQRIYSAVMADKSSIAKGADALQPASELDASDALDAMHPMPGALGDIDALKPYEFVKTKDKVLLVTPATRTVAAVISK